MQNLKLWALMIGTPHVATHLKWQPKNSISLVVLARLLSPKDQTLKLSVKYVCVVCIAEK